MDWERLLRQIEFITEIDKAKKIFRQNVVIGTKRNENDAEHSWHLAIMAMLLIEHSATKDLDILKVMKMVLIHDIVEIDAGDTFCYDQKAYEDKAEREQQAADRIFNILPQDQGEEFRAIWDEFEAQETPEACFANCLDRLQPLILNHNSNGHTWQRPEVNSQRVLERSMPLKENAPQLWEYVNRIVEEAIAKGYLKK